MERLPAFHMLIIRLYVPGMMQEAVPDLLAWWQQQAGLLVLMVE